MFLSIIFVYVLS